MLGLQVEHQTCVTLHEGAGGPGGPLRGRKVVRPALNLRDAAECRQRIEGRDHLLDRPSQFISDVSQSIQVACEMSFGLGPETFDLLAIRKVLGKDAVVVQDFIGQPGIFARLKVAPQVEALPFPRQLGPLLVG